MAITVETAPATTDANGTSSANGKGTTLKFASSDIILPPPDIKNIIARTASHVARSTTRQQFEDRIRESRREDPKFSFLNSSDPYNAYYKYRVERIIAGEEDEEATDASQNAKAMEVDKVVAAVDEGEAPPLMDYVLSVPPMPAVDVDIMKLTALFTAQRGRSFLAALSQKEGRNYQFDFLRPTSALFGLFNRMVEQYKLALFPPKETLAKINEVARADGKWKKLAEIRRRARWERIQTEKDKKREEDLEAERTAFAEIDWHEFAIVQTIEFTQSDAVTELPAPMTIQQMEERTLAEKRMAAMIMEDAQPELEALRAKESADLAKLEEAEMEQSDDEEAAEIRQRKKKEEEERAREEARARELQAKNLEHGGPMKIRKDYVPKTLVDKQASRNLTTTCQICGQQIPVAELDEHVRIELLDPRWKDKRDTLERARAQASELQRGADVSASLRTLAKKRVDIFGAEEAEERRRQEEEEERVKRKEREKVVWDGHTASKAGTMDKFQTNVNLDEQIAAIHRAHGLGQQDPNAMGPGIGPAVAPATSSLPPAPASLPLPPNPAVSASDAGFTAATVSAAPQPSVPIFNLAPGQAAPVVLPPLHYQGLTAAQPFGYAPPPPGMHPSRLAALGGPPPPVAGTVRSADEMMADGQFGAVPRPRVQRRPDGSLWPEETWIAYHPEPITVNVKLPDHSAKPEWKLDGSTVPIPEVTLSTLVSTLRDRIIGQIGSTVPLSRMRLQMGAITLSNSKSLAFYNVQDGEEVSFELREVKKK